jgi:hypothetical protein
LSGFARSWSASGRRRPTATRTRRARAAGLSVIAKIPQNALFQSIQFAAGMPPEDADVI